MKYRIHYFERNKLIAVRGKWTWAYAEKLLLGMGYKFDNKRKTFVKRKFQTAEIIGTNGIPF